MADETASAEVRHDQTGQRFVIAIGDRTALLNYRRRGRAMLFLHTEVPPEVEGQGIGGKLVYAALEYARAQQLQVIPLCPFVAAYIRRHPEYVENVPEEHRGKLAAERG